MADPDTHLVVLVIVLRIVFVDDGKLWKLEVPAQDGERGLTVSGDGLLDNTVDVHLLPPFLVIDKHFLCFRYIELPRAQEPGEN